MVERVKEEHEYDRVYKKHEIKFSIELLVPDDKYEEVNNKINEFLNWCDSMEQEDVHSKLGVITGVSIRRAKEEA